MAEIVSFQAPSYLLYGTVIAASLCLVFGVAAMFEPTRGAVISARRASPMQWVVTNFSAALVPKDEREREAVRLFLLQAGYDAPRAVEIYFAIRLIVALAAPLLLLSSLALYPWMPSRLALFVASMVAIIGFLGPIGVLRARRKGRQKKFRDGLPDMLDLLLICSEAGLGIDTAIMNVGEELREAHPLLAQQLRHVSTEFRAGLERKDAMRSFADRTGIEETVSLMNLLVQSDALGSSLAQTLRAFSDDMRAHRLLRAEEQGHKVSAKLTVVLVALFLPAIFAVVFAPAVYTALKGLHTLSGVEPW